MASATGINDAGQITGWGTYGSNFGRPFILTPFTPNTQVGSNIVIQPSNATNGGTPVSLTFSTITQSGSTTLNTSTSGPTSPPGFKLGQPPVYYNVSTTALYSGSITICINYSGVNLNNANGLMLWHFSGSSWTKLPTTINAATTTACATTPSLSPFALFEPTYVAQVQQPINSDGSSIFRSNRGVVPVKFMLHFGGVPTCTLPSATVALIRTAGGTIGSVDESVYELAADRGTNFRIDATACQYVYNLAAAAAGTGVYRVDILINAGVVGSGVFALRDIIEGRRLLHSRTQ